MARPLKEDLTNKRFGRLVVLSRFGESNRQPLWLCRCDCGNEVIRQGNGLRRGTVNSCGCLVADTNRRIRQTHGQTAGGHTRLYSVWNGMKQRCHNPNQPHYGRYGGRGIQVCERWRNSFADFYADMGDPPGPGYSLDRIDNNGNYEPGNVRWATLAEQRKNQRAHEPLGGEKHPMAKLTDDDVRAIRLSSLGLSKLAQAYGVDPRTIWAIRKRKTWAHVE